MPEHCQEQSPEPNPETTMQQTIQDLQKQVSLLGDRLDKVEAQNRKCDQAFSRLTIEVSELRREVEGLRRS